MSSDVSAADAAMFRALRHNWEAEDPHPSDLVERMVTAVAAADLSREYALLTLMESSALTAVRGDADLFTLQFGDGTTSVLIHITPTDSGGRRIDGWVDGAATTVQLLQDAGALSTTSDQGRFAFDDVSPGVYRLRIVLASAPEPGHPAEVMTPRFEL